MTPQHQRIVADCLTPVWRGIDADYKRKYALTIWKQFEDAIKASAYTDSLATFIERLMRRLGAQIAAADTARLAAFLTESDSVGTLKLLRGESALLVLLVRVANEERKAGKCEP